MLKLSESLKRILYQQSRVVAEPTPAQAEAGNYAKGELRMHGLLVTIETPKGKRRRPEWPPLSHHYGYINGMRKKSHVTYGETADGDHLDCFIGPYPEVELVYVVDQVRPKTREFDEHKVMLGFDSLAAAREGYLENYSKGWRGLGAITPLTIQQFKAWLQYGDQTKPLAQQVTTLKSAKEVLVLQDNNRICLVLN
jgi:hypothetical protein